MKNLKCKIAYLTPQYLIFICENGYFYETWIRKSIMTRNAIVWICQIIVLSNYHGSIITMLAEQMLNRLLVKESIHRIKILSHINTLVQNPPISTQLFCCHISLLDECFFTWHSAFASIAVSKFICISSFCSNIWKWKGCLLARHAVNKMCKDVTMWDARSHIKNETTYNLN